MRRTHLAWWMGALMAALTASGFAQAKQPPIMAAAPIVALMPVVQDNPDFFELTPAQQKEIDVIQQQSANGRIGLDQQILDVRAELQQELLKRKADVKLIERLRDDLLKAERERLQLSIDCANGLRRVLTDKQWATLLELATQ